MKLYKIAISLLFFTLSASASEIRTRTINSVHSAVPFLTIAPDSRAAAMGDVGVATSPDVNSLHWNPAKYAFIKADESVALSYSPWLRGLVNDMHLLYLTLYKRIDHLQVIAASLRYFNLGSIQFRDDQGSLMDVRSPNEFAIDAAYSRMFSDNFSAALAFRYVRSDISAGFTNMGGVRARAGNSFAADVAIYYHSDNLHLSDKSGDWALGINISNIGTKMAYSNQQNRMFIPTNLRLGGSIGLNLDDHNKMTFALDLNKLLVPTPPMFDNEGNMIGMPSDVGVVRGIFQSFYDAPGGFKEELREISYAMGIEYLYREVFAIRTGYFTEHPTKGNRRYFTMGFGLNMNRLGIDFSYLVAARGRHNPLNNTLRLTFVLNFGVQA